MRSTRRDALTAGGVVAALAIAGIALFLFSGSGDAVVFFFAGIPILLILGGVAWHRRETRSSTEASPRIESMTDDLADDVERLLLTYRTLERETPWDPAEYAESVREIQRDLENRGFEIDTDGDSIDVEVVEYAMGVGAISKHRENVQHLIDEVESGYREYLSAQIDAMNEQIDRLIDENLLEPEAADAVTPLNGATADPRRLSEALTERRKTYRDLLGDAVGRVHEVAEDAVVDREELDEHVAAGRYEAAADLVVEPEGPAGPDIGPKKAELLDLIDTVQSSVATQYADQSRFDELETVRGEIEEIESVYQITELDEELRPRVLRICAEIVGDLREELTDYIDTFSDPDVPESYFERPSVLERSHTEELRDAPNLEVFRSRWSGMVEDLASALEEASAREGALRAYDDVADVVERELAADGDVTSDEVPYDPAEPIMRLYAHRNTDVTFLESRPALTQGADIAGQEFDLDVDVRLDPPERRDVTVTVTIREETEQRTAPIDGAGTIEFEGILGGEATVTATVDDDRYGTRETEVLLDRDRTVELKLAEETAIDRLCEGVEADAELLLEEVAEGITATYDSTQYLTDEMDIGVQDEYKPCVLALWADDEGLSVRVEDDSVLVYDRQRMENQLVDLIEQKVGDDGELGYEEMRERFLKPPASDDLIRDILAHTELDVEVEFTDEKVVSA